MKRHYICGVLVFIFCITALSGCGEIKKLKKNIEYDNLKRSIIKEDTDWIDTGSKLGFVVMENTYYSDPEKEDKTWEAFRVYDFSTGTYSDHKVTLGEDRHLIPYGEGIGYAIWEYKNKKDHLYEILDDLSIGRKISVSLKSSNDVLALIDNMIYYELDTDPEFFSDYILARQNLNTGEVVNLKVDTIFSISNTHTIIGERNHYINKPIKDDTATVTYSISEIGILSPENEWTSIAKSGWECDFDAIKSACWLDDSKALIAMSASTEPGISLYVYDMHAKEFSRMTSGSGIPIYLYDGAIMDEIMYPDPSGEYIAYFRLVPGKIGYICRLYVLSLKTGEVSLIDEYSYTENETEIITHDVCADMLVWMPG